MNTFMNNLQNATNYTRTENQALSHKTSCSAVMDLFALGGSYRKRSNEDCILLFKNAFEENESLALKCLFWIMGLPRRRWRKTFLPHMLQMAGSNAS